MDRGLWVLGCNTTISGCPSLLSSRPLTSPSCSASANITFSKLNLTKDWYPRKHLHQISTTNQISIPLPLGTATTSNPNSVAIQQSQSQSHSDSEAYPLPILDKCGKFCNPRAARELALLCVYASCLEGSDPVRLFEKRLNAPKELYYDFDKNSLLQYDHMSFGGPPITTDTMEEAQQLVSQFNAESATEAAVLSAPPNFVYSKLLLRFTKKLLSTVMDRWDSHVVIIDQVIPLNWKVEPAGRILEFSILHLAMSEISGVGTRHQIVINEAVDLAKRFCDGAAPRTINGCLRTFVGDVS